MTGIDAAPGLLRTGTIWCPVCGAAAEYSEDSLLEFARSFAWPRCCGQTMSVTRPEHRLARPGGVSVGREGHASGESP